MQRVTKHLLPNSAEINRACFFSRVLLWPLEHTQPQEAHRLPPDRASHSPQSHHTRSVATPSGTIQHHSLAIRQPRPATSPSPSSNVSTPAAPPLGALGNQLHEFPCPSLWLLTKYPHPEGPTQLTPVGHFPWALAACMLTCVTLMRGTVPCLLVCLSPGPAWSRCITHGVPMLALSLLPSLPNLSL